MSWKAPRAYFLAGDLKGYKVVFFLADGTGRFMWWTFGPNTTAAAFGPFERNTIFCAAVVALNNYGEGVAADCVNITTRDGGREYCYCM